MPRIYMPISNNLTGKAYGYLISDNDNSEHESQHDYLISDLMKQAKLILGVNYKR